MDVRFQKLLHIYSIYMYISGESPHDPPGDSPPQPMAQAQPQNAPDLDASIAHSHPSFAAPPGQPPVLHVTTPPQVLPRAGSVQPQLLAGPCLWGSDHTHARTHTHIHTHTNTNTHTHTHTHTSTHTHTHTRTHAHSLKPPVSAVSRTTTALYALCVGSSLYSLDTVFYRLAANVGR